MLAVGFTKSLPLTEPDCLIDFEAPVSEPLHRQLLVRIKAAAVNPVDVKRRSRFAKDRTLAQPLVLGFEAAGIVESAGSACELFGRGDEVWFAGSIANPGCNAEFQLIDERSVALKPRSLSWEDAAALPLTGLTAWEALFHHMGITSPTSVGKRILIIGGAGGVGSIAIQLAKRVAHLEVTATASRSESVEWCRAQGADNVVSHSATIAPATTLGQFDFILNCASTTQYWDATCRLVAPEGKIVAIVETNAPLDLLPLMDKSASFAWEHMSTRSIHNSGVRGVEHDILTRLARLVDAGVVSSTRTTTLSGLSAVTIRRAHEIMETGRSVGKTVVVY